MKGEEVSEWKTQRYEGSVGVDGRWVVSRSEAEARVEAAERLLEGCKESLGKAHERTEAAERDGEKARNLWIDASNKLAAVREWRKRFQMEIDRTARDELDTILDREGEK